MGKLIKIIITILLLCSAVYADVPKTFSVPVLPAENTTLQSSSTQLDIESVNALMDLRYGTAVDRMIFYNNLFLAAIAIIVGVALFTGLHGANKKMEESVSDVKKASEKLDDQKQEYSKLFVEMEGYKESYKNILIADLADEARDLIDFNKSDYKKDGAAMKRIEALDKLSGLPQDLQLAKSAILFRQGKYLEALNIVEKMKEEDLNNADLYFKSGFCKHKLNEFNQAIIDYTQSLKIDDKNVSSLINRASIYIEQGRYSDAIKDFLKASGIQPSNPVIWQGLTNATLKSGKFDQTEQIFKIAEQKSIPIEDYLKINRICLWSQQDKFNECTKPLLDYIEEYPARIIEVVQDPLLEPLFKYNPSLLETINDKWIY
ncbi:hypothetical protein [uncultured Sphaerochaeta sp.]|uniref:tetratricopeptide repeat protein n=1 Tax=uncultured Sphaerochaeta sp. TaxID=886478 RepID=UPI002A0A4E06|nr:hypothetical protein [uncultured Sphaerochaeta sp.]